MAKLWFQHDYHASEDKKILAIRAEYGWEGYGIFWALLERMAKLETGAIEPEGLPGIAVFLNVNKDKLSEIVESCLDVGLFFEDENGWYRNKRMTKHVKKMQDAVRNGKKGAEKRWSKQSDRGAKRGGNADKIRGDNTKPMLQREDVPDKPPIRENDDFSDAEPVEVSEV